MKPKIYHSDEHHIKHLNINPDALYVIQKLHEAGFTTYLVGGGVRDLLRQQPPKDFDISTSATPQEVKAIFKRNCFIIGRRFRLAHVRFGKHILEVSTFRSGENNLSDELITQDNDWGSPEEDAQRRDFTINGLFYDPIENTVIDYVNGCQDLYNGILRTIGDPAKRFKQDPVRMIRLLKFKARFDYEIDSKSLKALKECHQEITKSSPARLAEEILRMLESGHSATFFKLMYESDILKMLLPKINSFFDEQGPEKILSYLNASDEIIKNSQAKHPDRAVLVSALFYPIMEEKINQEYMSKDIHPHLGQIIDTSYELINDISTSFFPYFPRKILHSVAYILQTQYRMTPLNKGIPKFGRLTRVSSFPSALKFLRLRSLVEESASHYYSTWKNHWHAQKNKPHNTNTIRRKR